MILMNNAMMGAAGYQGASAALKPSGIVSVNTANALATDLHRAWIFNTPENSSTIYDAVSGGTSPLESAASWASDGEVGDYISSDGSTRISNTGLSGVVGTSAGTVAIRLKQNGIGEHNSVMFGGDSGDDFGKRFSCRIEDGNVWLRVFGGATTVFALPNETWNWLVFSWSAGSNLGQVAWYLNGTSYGNAWDTRDLNFNTDLPVIIGGDSRTDGIADLTYDGGISDVFIWTRSLSALEVVGFVADPYQVLH